MYTLVNRKNEEKTVNGFRLFGMRAKSAYSCYTGETLKLYDSAGHLMLDITVEGLGLQCIYVTMLSDGDLPAQERDFLAFMRDMTRGKPLRGFSSDWTYLKQQLIEPAPVYNDTDGYAGMVKIVGT